MIETINQILEAAADISVVLSIGCLLLHIGLDGRSLFQAWRRRDVPTNDHFAWLGLTLFALWMACLVGRIGL